MNADAQPSFSKYGVDSANRNESAELAPNRVMCYAPTISNRIGPEAVKSMAIEKASSWWETSRSVSFNGRTSFIHLL